MSVSRVLLSRVFSLSNRLLFSGLQPLSTGIRTCTGTAGDGGAEARLIEILRVKFPGATDIQVVDVSGGCGSMYEVFIEASEFQGLRIVQQHKLVTEALKEEIKAMHGLRISTAVVNKCSNKL
jgi:stress-induced morphogen